MIKLMNLTVDIDIRIKLHWGDDIKF